MIERLSAMHFNTISYFINNGGHNRYLGCKIPKELIISSKNFIKITIDVTSDNGSSPLNQLNSIGTHDYK